VLIKLFLLFLITPLVELTLLLGLAAVTRWWVSLIVVILSGIIGAVLAKWQGGKTYRRIREEIGQGKMPGDALFDAGLLLFAGGLLLTPGVLTDLFGMSILVPRCREFYKQALKKRYLHRWLDPINRATGKTEVVDSYVVDSE